MPEPDLLPAFLVAVAIISAAPGPDMAFVVGSGIGGGRRAGAAAALGMSAGMVVHTALAAGGLAALLEAAPASLDAIRLAGAGYLAYLSVATMRSARAAGIERRPPVPARTVFRRGMITNLSNPKIILFFAAFLPQFVRPERGSAAFQFVVLGLLFLLVGLVADLATGLAAGQVRRMLATGARLPVVLEMLSALTFAAIAAYLLVDVLL